MKNNIILVWMPWSGKTNIWKNLAEDLNYNFLDFDDDIIEVEMNKTVAECLDELGDEKFLELEQELALDLEMQQTVLATSWSVALSLKAMNHLRTTWDSIIIDIPLTTIKQRLHIMKTDRIIWMNKMTLDEILMHRKEFYEQSYDYRFQTSGLGSKQQTYRQFQKWFYNIPELVNTYTNTLWNKIYWN